MAIAAVIGATPAESPAGQRAARAADPVGLAAGGVPDRQPIVSVPHGRARGTVILVHGGTWVRVGPAARRREQRRHAARLNGLGYRTIAITYRPGAQALPDVLAFYDRLRRRHPQAMICALGDSAGGHLVLMLAALRATLSCAISRGAPTDLTALRGHPGRVAAQQLATLAPLGQLSPVTYARRLAGRTLASQALDDPIVDHDQLVRLRRASHGAIPTISLPPGHAPYVHAPVGREALTALEHAEARLLAAAAVDAGEATRSDRSGP